VTNLRSLGSWLPRIPWIWSALGALLLWLAIVGFAHHNPGGTLTADLEIGSFLVLVGLGQLCVISSGNGNIDLSIPNVMTLSSIVALTVGAGGHGNTVLALACGLGIGLCVATCSIFCIFVLGIPPFVSTLGMGLIAQSVVLVREEDLRNVAPASATQFVTSTVFGIPTIVLLVLGITLLLALLLHRTGFGRGVFAVGQSRRAADRSGLRPTAIIAGCYVISGLLAATSGMALAASTGPSITLGDPYLLISVGTVVLGGSLILGGRGNVTGIWTAALLLNLIITFVYVLRFSVAVEDIFEGAVIIAVLSIGGVSMSSGTAGPRRRGVRGTDGPSAASGEAAVPLATMEESAGS